MNCKQYRTEIEDAAGGAGELTPRAESHAVACAECRTFGDEAAALRRLVADLPRVDAPPDFEFRLRARINAAGSAQPRPWSKNLFPRAAWLAAAACLALAAALALQTRNSPSAGARETAARPAVKQPVVNPAASVGGETAPRAVTGESNAGTRDAELANLPIDSNELPAAKRRPREASFEAANVVRPAQRRPVTEAAAQPSLETVASSGEPPARTETSTSSMIGAPVVVSTAIPLPVSADERPLQVLFKDTQGASRVVNVDPIAFGSNEPAARPTNVTFKKAKKQGVW
jgi:hypothetical protein